MKFFNYRRVPYAEIRAFRDILTASIVPGLSRRRRRGRAPLRHMFWWLGLALARSTASTADRPQGPGQGGAAQLVGRYARQRHRLRDLCAAAAFALYQSGMIGEPWSFRGRRSDRGFERHLLCRYGDEDGRVFLLRISGRLEHGRLHPFCDPGERSHCIDCGFPFP